MKSKRDKRRYKMNLPAHMAECDANYLRLRKLFPDLGETDAAAIGVEFSGARLEVRLNVLERSPYTTLVELKQEPKVPFNRKASITIRLYHDARSAEVVEYQGRRHFLRAVYDYPNADMRQPDEKAQINRFLGEYLSFCLTHGVAAEAPVPAN
jgi:uncharacterized protein YqiB (DUF1249 family)